MDCGHQPCLSPGSKCLSLVLSDMFSTQLPNHAQLTPAEPLPITVTFLRPLFIRGVLLLKCPWTTQPVPASRAIPAHIHLLHTSGVTLTSLETTLAFLHPLPGAARGQCQRPGGQFPSQSPHSSRGAHTGAVLALGSAEALQVAQG